MSTKQKTTAIQTVASEEQLAILRNEFPQEEGFKRTLLPRLGMFSQDVTEGKGMSMKVVSEAGTFFIEKETEEVNEDGKKIWEKEELGTDINVNIIFQRKQLKYYDEKTETYTSSSVYDNDDEVIPLFCNKAEIDKGTPVELKAREIYQYEKDGKTRSKLEDNRILYVLYEGELYQLNLRGSSMYSWMTFLRKNTSPSALLLKLSSEAKSKGSIDWNQMTFEVVRDINGEEAGVIIEKVREIKDAINTEKQFFASQNNTQVKSNLEQF